MSVVFTAVYFRTAVSPSCGYFGNSHVNGYAYGTDSYVIAWHIYILFMY